MDPISSGANGLGRDFRYTFQSLSEDIVVKDFESTFTNNFLQSSEISDGQHKRDEILYSCISKVRVSECSVRKKPLAGIGSNYDLNVTGLETCEFYRREKKESLEIIEYNLTMWKMRNELICWIKDTTESIRCLRDLADEIETIFRETTKAKIGGSVASIAGGIVSAVGFGLSFATFGSSLILAIVGGVVAGAGGVTTGTASIVNRVKQSSKTKAAEKAIRKYKNQLDEIKRKCIKISKTIEDIDNKVPEWVSFWRKLAFYYDCGKTGANAGWSVVGQAITNSLNLSRDLAGDASNASKTVFSVAGTAARTGHVVGGVVGILLLPVDLHTLISSAQDLGNGNFPKSAKDIRKIANEMERLCPTEKEVKKMIKHTLYRLECSDLVMYTKKDDTSLQLLKRSRRTTSKRSFLLIYLV